MLGILPVLAPFLSAWRQLTFGLAAAALDSPLFAVMLPSNQINPNIRSVPIRVVRPKPHIRKPTPELARMLQQRRPNQPLKTTPLENSGRSPLTNRLQSCV